MTGGTHAISETVCNEPVSDMERNTLGVVIVIAQKHFAFAFGGGSPPPRCVERASSCFWIPNQIRGDRCTTHDRL
jgi:hypothetical protein